MKELSASKSYRIEVGVEGSRRRMWPRNRQATSHKATGQAALAPPM